ncbi:hypothetical protein ACP43V_12335 [Vibrio genomosp. F10 str. 9ZC157]|uniref:hypothetical protein n=1 Tax=Vibrio genomosp. F10 TaxID=723171 RepID=UPI0002EA30AA|nr:hypothetical protein [Vibrio genomosp. F10]OEE94431.1 hypothetical protein A1QM_18675 [Vibrio genomosp. F10 str. 9ZC157]OEF05707.1 hypothetical protein A1QK_09055 [Vibrio genomosp. F10 str. 9ZD137]
MLIRAFQNILFFIIPFSALVVSHIAYSADPNTTFHTESNSNEEFDYVEFVNQTFDVTMSQSDFLGDYSNQYVLTLNASHNLNDDWRLFGSVDSDKFGDIGLGYSFFLFDTVYNEVSASVGGNTDKTGVYTMGIFSAFKYQDVVFFSNFDAQYIDRQNLSISHLDTQIRQERIYLNKLVGASYDVNDWLNLSTSYGHDKQHYNKLSFKKINNNYRETPNHADRYINLGFTLNLWGVKPYLSHHFDLNNSDWNYWDFSLSFDF